MNLLGPSGRTRLNVTLLPLLGPACALALVTSAVPRAARAQSAIHRFVLRGEAGGGMMSPAFQREQLGLQALVQGTVRVGFVLAEPFSVQGSFGSWYFPAANAGQVYSLTAGARIDAPIRRIGNIAIDVNGGLGQTADLSRVTLDAGAGFEFRLHPAVMLGPVFRYAVVFTGPDDYPSSASYWSLGASLALRVPEPAPPPAAPRPRDRDRDGVLDDEDLCPNEPAGSRSDPVRRGCPVHDRDRDGVPDDEDVCPDAPPGEHADPSRRGCPANDTDGDGVFDAEDRCPTTRSGEHPDSARPGCPAGDTDGDGVLDPEDQCRETPAGLQPDPSRRGCPLPDRDRDTVPDPTDACPDRAGAPNRDPRRNGCPGLVLVEGDLIRILRPVFFRFNRAVILPQSVPVLRAVADALSSLPSIRRVSIEGHTDDVGPDDVNLALSQARADAVMQWLIAHGVEPSRLEPHGYGETRPIVQATTAAARATNRRVEFRIVDPPMQGHAPPPPPAPTPRATGSGPGQGRTAPVRHGAGRQSARPTVRR